MIFLGWPDDFAWRVGSGQRAVGWRPLILGVT